MGKPFRVMDVAIGLASAMAVSSLLAVPSAAQTPSPAYKAPRLTGTVNPNLSGLWQTLNEGNWDVEAHGAQAGPPQFGALYAESAGPGIVEGGGIPFRRGRLPQRK